MRWSDLPVDPPPRTLRQFAGLFLTVFGALAAWEGVAKGRPVLGAVLGGLALVVGVVGLWRPNLVRPVYVGGVVLTFPIGWVVSQVVLALIYFGIFTPVGLIFRLAGRDALQRAWRPKLPSYWSPKPTATDPRGYFRQF
jgi:hypothetical protein